ncbi:MAG: aminodeoxychorismate synthase component I, partial [Gammaproteobacteria bacterium]|nr:aminodeoxychorismate synthase component I [Gammaproteobacteria bacterium]
MSSQQVMRGHRLTEIPYHPDSSRLFEVVADLPWAMFLDSGRPCTQQGRYDILVADPRLTLVTRGEETVICGEGASRRSYRSALELLREVLGEPYGDHSPLPFRGGAVGLFGYELRCDPANPHAADNTAGRFPDMAIGIYDWALVSDHQTRRSWLASNHLTPALARRWSRLVARFSHLPAKRIRTPYRAHGPV